MPGYFTDMDLMVVLMATAIHDVAHPGVSNDFLVKTRTQPCLYAACAIQQAWLFIRRRKVGVSFCFRAEG